MKESSTQSHSRPRVYRAVLYRADVQAMFGFRSSTTLWAAIKRGEVPKPDFRIGRRDAWVRHNLRVALKDRVRAVAAAPAAELSAALKELLALINKVDGLAPKPPLDGCVFEIRPTHNGGHAHG